MKMAFRSDFYLTATIRNFNLTEDSDTLLGLLREIPVLENIKMTEMAKRTEEFGRIRIEKWIEMTGGLKVSEGYIAFGVLCKDADVKEPFNIFMRIDRYVAAEDYAQAQLKTRQWIIKEFAEPLKKIFEVESLEVRSPTELTFIKEERAYEL